MSYFQYNTHGLLYLASALLSLTLGILVYSKDRGAKVNVAFFQFTVNTAIWTGAFGFVNLMRDVQDIYFWISISYFYGITFIPVSTIWLGLSLRKKKSRLLMAGYVSASLFAIPAVFFSRQLTTYVTFPWGIYPAWQKVPLGILSYCGIVGHFIFFTPIAIHNFYRFWGEAKTPYQERQGLFLVLGFLIVYTGTLDFLTAMHVHIYPFGYISLTIFSCIIFYTIVQHQLLDVKIVLKKISLIVFVYAALLIVVLPIAPVVTKRLLASTRRSPTEVLIEMSILIGLIFSLGPILYAAIVRNTYWLRGHQSTGLVHELKSPLSTIETASEMLIENIKEPVLDRNKALEYASMIQNNAARLQDFVKDLLLLAREESDSATLSKESFDLTALAVGVQNLYRSLAENKKLAIVISNTIPVMINADKAKIQHVLSNLLSNAIKFSEQGQIEISIMTEDSYVLCAVKDSGKGIAAAHLKRVFEKFFQVDQGQKGTGIGLTIAKTWVGAHGGKIWVESEGEGKGATFKFTVPV